MKIPVVEPCAETATRRFFRFWEAVPVGSLVPTKNGVSPAQKAASKTQLAEMQALVQDAVEESENGSGTKALATALRKRSWLKRGFAAGAQCGEMIDHCPAAEKPFYEYADRLHDLVLKKMLALGDSRSRGDFRVYSQLLETLWREEYGKKDTAVGGVAVVIVERPPRD